MQKILKGFINCDKGWMVRFARMQGMQERIDNSQRARIARMQETLKEFMGQLGHASDDL